MIFGEISGISAEYHRDISSISVGELRNRREGGRSNSSIEERSVLVHDG